MQILSLFHGARPALLTLIGAWIFGIFFGGYVLSLTEFEITGSLLCLAACLGLSTFMVSHATEPTRTAWRKLGHWWPKLAFIVVQLLVYPPLIFWMAAEDASLIILLHAMLVAKLMLFLSGQWGKGA